MEIYSKNIYIVTKKEKLRSCLFQFSKKYFHKRISARIDKLNFKPITLRHRISWKENFNGSLKTFQKYLFVLVLNNF